MRKESIREKIMKAVVSPLLLIAVVLGLSAIFVVNQLASEDAALLMTQLCEKETFRLDNRLNLVQHSVSIIYDYINETNEESRFELFSEEYSRHIREYAISVSNQTDGAMAVYYRFDPELTGVGTGGFFWSRMANDGRFAEEPPTDILAYNTSDVEHVGWFFVPKETKEPLWMKPYFNQNLNVFMISYIIPVYSEQNDFLGVVGMDIDFNSILKSESTISLYETGKVALVDLTERLVYTAAGDNDSYSERMPNKLYNHITTINKASDVLEITEDDGSQNVICCRRLLNGMTLYVTVPRSEIYANRDQLLMTMALLTILICCVAIWNVHRQTTRIIEPINQLAEVTGHYANGDWSHSYVCDSGDELQKLSESIQTMAMNTQGYITSLNELARTDGLTGIRNKTSYLEFVEEIKLNRHRKYDHYALVVMDVNLLKKTNDTYGHEAGDLLLIEAGKYICRIFLHSAVFRIGGDEFVALLLDNDYDNRHVLCEAFEKGMHYDVARIKGIPLSISYGLASLPEDSGDFEALFKLADDRMYAKKKEMKAQREG